MRPMRILIADDNKDAAESLGILLEMSGHDVRVVLGGRTALEATTDWPADLAVLDLDMPDMNGFATARALRHRFPGIRLVALSGFLDEENRRQASLIGFGLCVAKGSPFGELRAAIDELLQQAAGTAPRE